MHQITQEKFGFPNDNYIGGSVQKNGWSSSWSNFFWEKRLWFQANLLDKRYASSIKKELKGLKSKIKDILHEASPSLLHGDLWGGNVISAKDKPFLIDPAVYYGDREADIAMTRLFGDFSDDFYNAYTRKYPLEKGYEKREAVYNLYHLLNHLNLFGDGYRAQVKNSLEQIKQGIFKVF